MITHYEITAKFDVECDSIFDAPDIVEALLNSAENPQAVRWWYERVDLGKRT